MANEEKLLTVFAQGMRRSGTTIWFDLMMEDGTYECFYEPLAAGKTTLGGGSSAHANKDLFANLRLARERFLKENPQLLKNFPGFVSENLLNYGAPRKPELEFETELPGYCKEYILFLIRSAPKTFLKFTRMYSKVAVLKELVPDARLLHLVRDPRHVTTSYMFGKNGKYKDRFPDADTFFSKTSAYTAWSSRAFSDLILKQPQYRHLAGCPDFMSILLIWKYAFEQTHVTGKKLFGDNYLLLRHEDLLIEPHNTVSKLGAFIGSPLNPRATNWVKENLRSLSTPFAKSDPRWELAFKQLKMSDTLLAAGY